MKTLITLLLLFTITVQAQVGINTDQPTKTLDVNGQVRIRNLPLGDSTDFLVVADSQGNLRKITISSLNSNNTCPTLIKSQSSGHTLLFTSSSSIPNPNDPITVQGSTFVSAGTWIANNTYFYSYTKTAGSPINLNIVFTVSFGSMSCTYN